MNHHRFRSLLLAWYQQNAREFLWRAHSPNPYHTLVSETMLQQTQAARVAEKLPLFLEKFPTIQDLARAENAEILVAWRGLGYNSRALRLRDCAKSIVTHFAGAIPNTYTELRTLPGIGDYCASAILSFAFRQDVLVLDVNIRRVYSRILGNHGQSLTTTADVLSDDVLRSFAEEIFPKNSSSEWHQAIMDIGATICTARKPLCTACPIQEICASAGTLQEKLPPKRAEPMFRGQPRRIWRGRIIELLRQHHSLSESDLLRELFSPKSPNNALALPFDVPTSAPEESISAADRTWLRSVLEALFSENLIHLTRDEHHRGNDWLISL